jgi:integrase
MGRRGNSEGSITRYKKSGLYIARYWIETKDGRKRKTIYGKKRKDVADELVKVLSEGADGIFYNDENERWRID